MADDSTLAELAREERAFAADYAEIGRYLSTSQYNAFMQRISEVAETARDLADRYLRGEPLAETRLEATRKWALGFTGPLNQWRVLGLQITRLVEHMERNPAVRPELKAAIEKLHAKAAPPEP